jgi:hypothetical protein
MDGVERREVKVSVREAKEGAGGFKRVQIVGLCKGAVLESQQLSARLNEKVPVPAVCQTCLPRCTA